MNDEKRKSTIIFFIIIVYVLILSIGVCFNIQINYLGKGNVWDLYPLAEVLWVIISVVICLKVNNYRKLVFAVIIFLLLDSGVDLVAMGHQTWYAGPPIIIEWKWGIVDTEPLLTQYWFFKWTLQTPVRCLALALVISNPFRENLNHKYNFLVVCLVCGGLNVIWASASHDFLFYFVWWQKYDFNFPYFHYMSPAGTWNFYNMLFIRIPIMYGIGIPLIYIGKKIDFLKVQIHSLQTKT